MQGQWPSSESGRGSWQPFVINKSLGRHPISYFWSCIECKFSLLWAGCRYVIHVCRSKLSLQLIYSMCHLLDQLYWPRSGTNLKSPTASSVARNVYVCAWEQLFQQVYVFISKYCMSTICPCGLIKLYLLSITGMWKLFTALVVGIKTPIATPLIYCLIFPNPLWSEVPIPERKVD